MGVSHELVIKRFEIYSKLPVGVSNTLKTVF